jgi:hypothetical protein
MKRQVTRNTDAPDSARHVKQPDLLRLRAVERTDRLGDGRHLQHEVAPDLTCRFIYTVDSPELLQKLWVAIVQAHDFAKLGAVTRFVLYDFAPDFDLAE